MKTLVKFPLPLGVFFLAAIFLSSIPLTSSNADIIFKGQNGGTFNSAVPFDEASIASADGDPGDFEVLGCTVPDEGQIIMNPATPDWITQDIGGCAGNPFCVLGVFTKFSETSGGEPNTCSWEGGLVNIFAGGLLRYGGVDPFEPVTAVKCDESTDITAVAPSVQTTANSVVVRIFAATQGPAEGPPLPDFGIGRIFGITFNQGIGISSYLVGQPFEEAGESGTLELPLMDTAFWRACSVALQMDTGKPLARSIPTLSEWGLIAMAGVLGILGLIVLRKKTEEV